MPACHLGTKAPTLMPKLPLHEGSGLKLSSGFITRRGWGQPMHKSSQSPPASHASHGSPLPGGWTPAKGATKAGFLLFCGWVFLKPQKKSKQQGVSDAAELKISKIPTLTSYQPIC